MLENVLFLTTVLPGKRRMGSEVASQAIIDQLCEMGYSVAVVGYVRSEDKYTLQAYETCVGRRHIESSGAGVQKFGWLARSFIKRSPYSVEKFVSRDYISTINECFSKTDFRFVFLDHVQISWIREYIPKSCKVIGIAHNVEHGMYRGFGASSEDVIRKLMFLREASLIEKSEERFVKSVDQLWVLTESDREYFSKLKGDSTVFEIPLPASKQVDNQLPVKKEYDVALIGSWTWKANDQGLRWFFNEVYPLLPASLRIHVAGSGADWLSGRHENVEYEGFVEDASHFLRRARVIAIPTLSGGGIQIKTLDAIATGVSVVATPLAVRGISKYPRSVTVADSAREFSALIVKNAQNVHYGQVCSSEAILWSKSRLTEFRNAIVKGIKDLSVLTEANHRC